MKPSAAAHAKLISVIIPVLNEEPNILPAYKAVSAILDGLAPKYEGEILFTDNHSTDATFNEIQKLAAKDPRVRGLRFSRNVGYQKSIETGYFQSKGSAVIQLDCDLQDPPELIQEFIRLWEKGYMVVYGVRQERAEGWFINTARKCFYRLVTTLSDEALPLDAGDFRLVDRRLLDELQKLEDAQPYLRGAIANLGFDQIGVPFRRLPRTNGTSKFSFFSYVRFALNGILNHSIVPLRIASYCGLIISFVTFLSAFGYLAGRLFFGKDWPAGFATTILLLLSSFSITAMFLGIIGEYIARIYRQIKKQWPVIVEKEASHPSASEFSRLSKSVVDGVQ